MEMPAGYDEWKLRSGYDDRDTFPSYDEYEPELYCTACEDVGWMEYFGHVIPCTECSSEVEMEDV